MKNGTFVPCLNRNKTLKIYNPALSGGQVIFLASHGLRLRQHRPFLNLPFPFLPQDFKTFPF
jgi:branched-subunit amino acid aminotransferase/4-amino-4-deoxychorismate lyase